MKKILQRLAALAALGLVTAVSLHAELQMKETTKGKRFIWVNSAEQVAKLEKGDAIAMVCAKGKTIQVNWVREKGHYKFLEPGTAHACAGCGSKIQIRKGTKESEMVHVCKACGSESAFCCATQKDDKKTSGM